MQFLPGSNPDIPQHSPDTGLCCISKAGPRRFQVRIAAKPNATLVELIVNGKVSARRNNNEAKEQLLLDFELDRSLVANDWILVRITFHGGEKAWSSPRWGDELTTNNGEQS